MIKQNFILLSLILTMSANTTPIFASEAPNNNMMQNAVVFDEISLDTRALASLKKQQKNQLKTIHSTQEEVDTLFYNKEVVEEHKEKIEEKSNKNAEKLNHTSTRLEGTKETLQNTKDTIKQLTGDAMTNPSKDTIKEIATLKFEQVKQAQEVKELNETANIQTIINKVGETKKEQQKYKANNIQKEYDKKTEKLTSSFETNQQLKTEIIDLNESINNNQTKVFTINNNNNNNKPEKDTKKYGSFIDSYYAEENERLEKELEKARIAREEAARAAEEAARAKAEVARIEAERKAAEEQAHRARGQAVVDAAMSKLGSPYVWGAQGPNSFDCSGLVWWAHRQAGVNFGRTTAASLAHMGQEVSISQLQPGDIITTTSDGRVSHVVIYIGNGKIVHAPQTGDVVKVSSLASRKGNIYSCRRLY